ncbi:MAG: YceD family protein [Alphaproteobacteria bacterium]|nr:YceD family protein [Alphaproteobacteria bacterium]
MKKPWDPQRLDVRAFARDGATLSGQTPMADMPRLQAERTDPDQAGAAEPDVLWVLKGENKDLRGGAHQTWLRVQAQAQLRLMCQRCLEPLAQTLNVDRLFRFVSTEEAAQAEDDQAEEDLLVANQAFDALCLVEDELILAMPLVPRHDDCQPPA